VSESLHFSRANFSLNIFFGTGIITTHLFELCVVSEVLGAELQPRFRHTLRGGAAVRVWECLCRSVEVRVGTVRVSAREVGGLHDNRFREIRVLWCRR